LIKKSNIQEFDVFISYKAQVIPFVFLGKIDKNMLK